MKYLSLRDQRLLVKASRANKKMVSNAQLYAKDKATYNHLESKKCMLDGQIAYANRCFYRRR